MSQHTPAPFDDQQDHPDPDADRGQLLQVAPSLAEAAATIATQLVTAGGRNSGPETSISDILREWTEAANRIYDWIDGRDTPQGE